MKNKELIGIIGGSGLYAMADFRLKKKVSLVTPFGKPSDAILLGILEGQEVAFLPRHGVGHRINPTHINFRANIWALKKIGVTSIISVSAVGSLKEEIKPGDMVVVDQFIDRTYARESSFFDQEIVAHVSLADPTCSSLRLVLIEASHRVGASVHPQGTYLCMEGPQFSTKAESHWYRLMNAHVIGMTNIQEAKLAREAEICYATLALSTDYDCWRVGHEEVTASQVVEVLKNNIAMAQKILKQILVLGISPCTGTCRHALAHAILTDQKKISAKTKKKFSLLIGKYI